MSSLSELVRHPLTDKLTREYTQKNDYSCGYYCAKALIKVIGNGDVRNLTKELRLDSTGIRQNNLIKTLRNREVSASVYYQLTLTDMRRFLDQGKYIIVYDHVHEHWFVLIGVKLDVLEFYDADRFWRYKKYASVKEKLNGFGIVCGEKLKFK